MDFVNEQAVSSTAPVDHPSALQWVDGDQSLLAEMAEIFAADCPKRMNELGEALKAGNAHLINRTAHSLKGMVSGFGARQAQQLAEEMEHLGRSGDLEKASHLFPALTHEMSRVIEHLKGADWQAPT
jgi:HPt (histidine-containing phosphotransfer) domain-containing protein